MDLPAFLKQENEKLLYKGTGELQYYIPEDYFVDTKQPPAEVAGQYVNTMGIFDWGLMDEHGKVAKINPFKWPTIISCKPNRIEKVKDFSIKSGSKRDYRILHFTNGDEAISNIYTAQSIESVETVFKMIVINGNKIPNTIPYDKLQDYFPQAMELSGNNFKISMQLFGIMVSEICRDPKDLSKPFRYSSTKDMTNYKQINIKMIPKYSSPYIAMTSENFDNSLMASVLMSDLPEDEIKSSPLEKVVMQ